MEQNLNKYYIKFRDEYLQLLVLWLRPTDSDTENLLTRRSKHSFFELHYVLTGSLQIQTEGGCLCLEAGDFLLLPPDAYHEITHYEEHTKKLVFGFDVEFVSAQLQDAMLHIVPQKRKDTPVMRSLSELLIDIGTREPGYSGVQIRCLTEALLFEIVSLTVSEKTSVHPVCKKDNHDYKSEIVKRMTACVRQKAGTGGVTVQALADMFHMSKRHLSRLCEEITGKTPRQIIDEERLNYLRELLATTDYPLSKIAVLADFSSENAMIRFFRSKEGYTPSAYRRYTTQ